MDLEFWVISYGSGKPGLATFSDGNQTDTNSLSMSAYGRRQYIYGDPVTTSSNHHKLFLTYSLANFTVEDSKSESIFQTLLEAYPCIGNYCTQFGAWNSLF